MDKSLDDIIKAKPRTRRTRRPSAKAQVVGKKQAAAVASPVAKAQRKTVAKQAPPAVAQVAEKIIVSNLPVDVNEAQLRELFVQTVGPIRDIALHYDAGGRWKGSATIHFQKKGDGTSAYNQYNGRLIDGKRAMKIEVVVDPSVVPPAASLVSRVAPAKPKNTATAKGVVKGAAPVEGVRKTGVRRGKRTRGARTKATPKTVADLDAEMEDYTTAGNAPVASAAVSA